MEKNLISSLLFFKKGVYSVLNKKCEDIGITSAEFFALGILDSEGDCHQKRIARELDCDKAHIHRILLRLMDKGLAQFVYSQDGKDKRVGLTDKGNKIMKTLAQIVDSILDTIHDGISKEDIALVDETIEKYADNIMSCKKEIMKNV